SLSGPPRRTPRCTRRRSRSPHPRAQSPSPWRERCGGRPWGNVATARELPLPGTHRRTSMFEVRGAVAVVTGASSGLGRRFALDLAARGATVVGLARRQDLLAGLGEEIRRFSPRSSTVVCDVSDTGRFVAVLGDIDTEHGRIDVLVNNAGVGPPRGEVPPDLEVYRTVMETNYFATVAGTLAA